MKRISRFIIEDDAMSSASESLSDRIFGEHEVNIATPSMSSATLIDSDSEEYHLPDSLLDEEQQGDGSQHMKSISSGCHESEVVSLEIENDDDRMSPILTSL
jgi:hypothetical protein